MSGAPAQKKISPPDEELSVKVKVVGRRARSATLALRWFYPLGFITLGFTSLVSTPSAFINKTGTVLFPLAINCLSVCVSVCVCVCLSVWMSPFHFESVTLCVCARNNLTSNCEQKRTLHFSMTGNFFSMTRNFFASPGNFFAFDSLHFWMTKKCTERLKGVFCCWEGARSAPDLSMCCCMRIFCESESGGGKSAKRDLGVAVVLPPWIYHPWVYQSCFHAVGIY